VKPPFFAPTLPQYLDLDVYLWEPKEIHVVNFKFITTLLLLLASHLQMQAQQQNPFDIKDRLPPRATNADTEPSAPDSLSLPTFDSSSVDSSTTIVDSVINALATDTLPKDSIGFISIEYDTGTTVPEGIIEEPKKMAEDSSAKIIEGIKQLGEQLPEINGIDNQNLLFIISVLILLLLATLLAVSRSMINKAYKAIANDNYLRFLYREYQSMPGLYRLFYLYFFINAGFFLYLTINHYDLSHPSAIFLLFISIGAIALIYIVKHLVLNIVSTSFPVDKEAHLYSFVTMLINILLGVVLTPVNLIVAFAPEPFPQILIWIGLAAILLFYLFRQLKGLFISGRFLAQYQFHFFLYLCTIEIAPLLIIGKLALGKLGFQ